MNNKNLKSQLYNLNSNKDKDIEWINDWRDRKEENVYRIGIEAWGRAYKAKEINSFHHSHKSYSSGDKATDSVQNPSWRNRKKIDNFEKSSKFHDLSKKGLFHKTQNSSKPPTIDLFLPKKSNNNTQSLSSLIKDNEFDEIYSFKRNGEYFKGTNRDIISSSNKYTKSCIGFAKNTNVDDCNKPSKSNIINQIGSLEDYLNLNHNKFMLQLTDSINHSKRRIRIHKELSRSLTYYMPPRIRMILDRNLQLQDMCEYLTYLESLHPTSAIESLACRIKEVSKAFYQFDHQLIAIFLKVFNHSTLVDFPNKNLNQVYIISVIATEPYFIPNLLAYLNKRIISLFKLWHLLRFYLTLCYIDLSFIPSIPSTCFQEKFDPIKLSSRYYLIDEFYDLLYELSYLEEVYYSDLKLNPSVNQSNSSSIHVSPLLSIKEYGDVDEILGDNIDNLDVFFSFAHKLPNLPHSINQILLKLIQNFNTSHFSDYLMKQISCFDQPNFLDCLKLFCKYDIWSNVYKQCKSVFEKYYSSNPSVNLSYKLPSDFLSLELPLLSFKTTISHIGNVIPAFDIEVNMHPNLIFQSGSFVILFKQETKPLKESDIPNRNNSQSLKDFIIGTIYYSSDEFGNIGLVNSDKISKIPMLLVISTDFANKIDLFSEYYIIVTNEDASLYNSLCQSYDYDVSDPPIYNCNESLMNDLKDIDSLISSVPQYLQIALKGSQIQEEIANNFLVDLPDINTMHNISLDNSQLIAINKILNSRISMTLGPPKSGKTELALYLLRVLANYSNNSHLTGPVIIVTNSDSKLYDITERLLGSSIDFVFIDPELFKTPENLIPYHIDSRANSSWGKDEKILWNNIQKEKEILLMNWRKLIDMKVYLDDYANLIKLFIFILPKPLSDSFIAFGDYFNSTRSETLETAIFNWFQLKPKSGKFKILEEMFTAIDFDELIKDIKESYWPILPENIWKTPSLERKSFLDHLSKLLSNFIQRYQYKFISRLWKLNDKIEQLKAILWSKALQYTQIVLFTKQTALENFSTIKRLFPRIVFFFESEMICDATLLKFIKGLQLEHLVLFGNPYYKNTYNTSLSIQSDSNWRRSIINKLFIDGPNVNFLANYYGENCSTNSLVSSFYPHYTISDRVLPIKHPKGVLTPLAFINTKTMNEVEARKSEILYISNFYKYLLQQGYNSKDIALYTMTYYQYIGLSRNIFESLIEAPYFCSLNDKEDLQLVNILSSTTSCKTFEVVIILLDQRRDKTIHIAINNLNQIIKGLANCKSGVYIFGNIDHYEKTEELYKILEQIQSTGDLKIYCQNHPDTVYAIKEHSDFDIKSKDGGCEVSCNRRLNCGHSCPANCHTWKHSQVICDKPCSKIRNNACSHPCTSPCSQCKEVGCPPCFEEIDFELKCGHIAKIRCSLISDGLDNYTCNEVMEVGLLTCKHFYKYKCYENYGIDFFKSIICKEPTKKLLDCGHEEIAKCYEIPICKNTCQLKLECGHNCIQICSTDHSHSRQNCKKECIKKLICDHSCQLGCSSPDVHTMYCLQSCNLFCPHKIYCPRFCHEPCILCSEPCLFKCEHGKCSKLCFQPCDRLPCQHKCQLFLECGHECDGYCGEPCPPCHICNFNIICPISLLPISEMSYYEKLYKLPDCGCVFYAHMLDKYIEGYNEVTKGLVVSFPRCPKCGTRISSAPRYEKAIKNAINIYMGAKKKLADKLQALTSEEQTQIVSAMEESLNGLYDIVNGRWFSCPNGHPYYIGECGGATQLSKCPECGAIIGGTSHRIVSSNKFYGEFDNSLVPAWPGQH